ncbi:MAG: 5'-3' exonuclease, partial [Actinomycetes bacterium]
YFRAFYGVPDSLKAPDGTPVNAVRGFMDMLARLITERRPRGLVACWDDDWRPAFRVEALPSYKAHRVASDAQAHRVASDAQAHRVASDAQAHRVASAPAPTEEEVPDTLAPQVPVIAEVLAAVGLARVGAAGFEADDVIATLAARASGPVEIVTGDRDLFQVVRDDGPVHVLYTARGIARLETIDDAEVRRRYGVRADQYADFATLRGDPSDGLPGVAGVGDKTAAGLVSTYGSLSGIREAALDPASPMAPGLRRKLLDAAAYLDAAPGVVQVRRDVPLPDLQTAVPRTPHDPEAFLQLSERWGLRSSGERLLQALAAQPA